MSDKQFTAWDMVDEYVVGRNLPTIWCPGCGTGIVYHAMMRAIHNLELAKEDVIFSVGIGCSGFASRYVNFDCIHTTHGRAIAAATGIKIAKPKSKVLVFTGDGDCLAIGGNHFIHAARRNIDMTIVLVNNFIYGMTGGQYSPETPENAIAKTSPWGMIEGNFDACQLAKAAGATYVARGTTAGAAQLTKLIEGAIAHNGFSVVDCITQCPSQFGSLNKLGTGAQMMRGYQRDYGANKPGAFQTGVLFQEDRPEYTDLYAEVQKKAREGRA